MIWIPINVTAIFALIIQAIIVTGYFWFPKYRKAEESYDCWLLKGMRAFAFLFLVTMALVFIDTNIKLMFGIVGYSNFALHLSSLILTFIIAIQVIIGAVFVKPNRKGLICFALVIGVFIYTSQFHFVGLEIDEFELFGTDMDVFIFIIGIPIVVGLIAAIIFTSIELILRKKGRFEDKPFWDKQVKAKKIFSFKFNIILWLLTTAEFILILQGMSLLLWLTNFI
jgi:hypothetical protein